MRQHSLTYLIFLILSVFSFENVKGQVLVETSITPVLPAGQQIYDVIDIPSLNCFMVVGSFTQINGIPRNKLAFLSKDDLHLLTAESWANPISSIDGDIYTAAFAQSIGPGLPILTYYHLYIGGNFNNLTVNGTSYSRNGIAKLRATLSLPGPAVSTFSMQNWNPQLTIPATPDAGVRDMDVSNDTLFYLGDFYDINNGTLPSDERPYGVAAVKITNNTNLNMFTALNGTVGIKKIDWHKNKLYVSGELTYPYPPSQSTSVLRLDGTGACDPSFAPLGFMMSGECACLAGIGGDFSITQDSILVYQWGLAEGTNQSYGYNIDPTPGTIYSSPSTFTKHTSIATYKNHAYLTRDPSFDDPMDFFKPTFFEKNFNSFDGSTGQFSEQTNCQFNDFKFEHIWVAENLLFVSDNNLTEVGYFFGTQYSRSGVAIYCLEPHDATSFTIYDTLICPDQIQTYEIPAVQYADGYVWEYSGQGVDIGVTGTQNLSDTITLTSANSVQIKFLQNFTPGILSITPFSNFQGQLVDPLEIVKSNTISLNIYSNPLPNVIAGNDTSINCYNDTIGVQLFGYSDSLVSSYTWVYPNPFDNVSGQIDTVETAGTYIFKAVSLLGCPNYDTVIVSMDTIKPNVTLPPPPYLLSCAVNSQTYSGSSSTPNTTLQWYQDTSQYFSDPFTVTAPGQYYLEVTDNTNGCKKAEGIFVDTDFEYPNIKIVGYPSISLPLETLTCSNPSINLTCYSDSSNTTTEWMEQDTSAFYGSTLSINSGGYYFIFATDSDNGCTNSLGINIAEFFNEPGVGTGSVGELNCSVDSLILFGASLTAGAAVEWTGGSISTPSNPMTIYDAGTYYITATHPDNGCTSTDSVVIAQTNAIIVDAGNDQLVCKNEIVNLNANYAGTISGISYLWNNGSSTSNASFTAGDSPFAIAEIFGDGGCYGIDSVELNIPPVPVINFEGFKPCDDGPSGQIVATPVSGLSPFSYSIDNGNNFQTSPVFTDLYIGTYPILVRDSIQCEYNFTAIIDENSSLPVPSFLFSTYNFETDTVVIIDVSNPPTDSTNWIFPHPIIVLDNNSQSPMILLPDTGAFSITMQAYYGNCLVEISKMIYASPYDSLHATMYNLNGIKSIELYPNPTSGNFTVHVEFYKSQRSAMVVQDMIANTYYFEEFDESTIISQDISLDLTVLDGTYVLKVVSEFDSASITFILAR